MTKRILGLILALAMLCAFVPCVVSAETNLKVGDYIQMGTYYDEPILWRVVSFEKISGYDSVGNPVIDSTDTVTEYQEGYLPLLLSDKIICLKPFDAETSTNPYTGSHSRIFYRAAWGSNYWKDSNMRSWLNSTASSGNVTWLCGNPPTINEVTDNAYDSERGFLTNFEQSELESIKTVVQKSIVAYPEYNAGLYDSGVVGYTSNDNVQNYEDAYSEQVTDNVFLLDVKQLNTVFNNSYILGEDYYIGELNEQCVNNSERISYSLKTEDKWYYWLRTPCTDDDDAMWYVYSDGCVFGFNASYGIIGVRPAFFLSNTATFASGSGTADDPYTVVGSSNAGTDTPVVVAPSNNTVIVILNGVTLVFDYPPTIIDGRTLVPLRKIFESIGATVTWDDATKTVISTYNGVTITLTIGSNVLYKNGYPVELDVPAQLLSDYTMVPVRAVAESFGADVAWDASTNTVSITTK